VAVVQYTFTHKQYIEQHKQYIEQHNWDECGLRPVFASYTLASAFQLRKKHRKKLSLGSQRMPAGTMKTEYTEQ